MKEIFRMKYLQGVTEISPNSLDTLKELTVKQVKLSDVSSRTRPQGISAVFLSLNF